MSPHEQVVTCSYGDMTHSFIYVTWKQTSINFLFLRSTVHSYWTWLTHVGTWLIHSCMWHKLLIWGHDSSIHVCDMTYSYGNMTHQFIYVTWQWENLDILQFLKWVLQFLEGCNASARMRDCIIWQFPLKMLHPRNPPNREIRIPRYNFKLNQNLDLDLFRKIPRKSSFSIWWISGIQCVHCNNFSKDAMHTL